MGKQCDDAKQLGEPHEVAPGAHDHDLDLDEDADGKLPDRCPLHRRQRKRWRDNKSTRRRRAREANEPVPPDEPWEPVSLRKKDSPVTVEAVDRDYLHDLLDELDQAAGEVRLVAAGTGSTRLNKVAADLTGALDTFNQMFDSVLPEDKPVAPVKTRPGATTRPARP